MSVCQCQSASSHRQVSHSSSSFFDGSVSARTAARRTAGSSGAGAGARGSTIAGYFRLVSKMVLYGPRPLVLCGPSGSGKSTLLKRLLEEFPERYGFSVSHTTRKPRPGEKDGVHYHFTTLEEMKAAIDRGDFLETATFSGNMYGTSKRAVDEVRRSGKVCVLDIEIEGVKQVKQTDLNPLLVFVMPPSIEELERRLQRRGTETPEALQKRLDTARKEIEYGKQPGNFHIIILNDNLKKAYVQLRDFIAENMDEKDLEAGEQPDK